MNIEDRIFKAIGDFVQTHNYIQSVIWLSSVDYAKLHKEAESTELGRSFLIGRDMKFCDLEVKIHPDNEKEIVIS